MTLLRLTSLIVLTAGLALGARATAGTAGEAHRLAHVPSAALRNADHRDDVRVTVWYPAVPDAAETPVQIGPPGAPLFESGRAASDAPVAPGRFPVVLFSHGNGGSARMMAWFGTALARAGYVVIAVDHPGNNGVDAMTVAGSTLVWERADDLRAALALVRQDPVLGPHLDTRHMGVADPGSIVWDEIVAIWLVLWLAMPMGFWGQLAAFALFRYFDAAKPGPVRWADGCFKGFGWRGGFGILFDDLVAAFCTLLVIALWRWFW